MCNGYIDRLPLTCSQLGTWPTIQACSLTGNRTGTLQVCRLALNPLSHTSHSCVWYFKRNCLEFQNFIPPIQSLLVFVARSYEDLSSWHWKPRQGSWCGFGTPHSQDIPPEFLSTTHGCGTSLACICDPPTSLDGCGFFNSIVVRLPFNSISNSSE